VRVNKQWVRHPDSKTDGTASVGTLASNQILDMFEVFFSRATSRTAWTVTLTSPDAADLDLYLYPADGEYYWRSSGSWKASQTSGTPPRR
jgi:hypothetical protein